VDVVLLLANQGVAGIARHVGKALGDRGRPVFQRPPGGPWGDQPASNVRRSQVLNLNVGHLGVMGLLFKERR
jgi:hypothetical protein